MRWPELIVVYIHLEVAQYFQLWTFVSDIGRDWFAWSWKNSLCDTVWNIQIQSFEFWVGYCTFPVSTTYGLGSHQPHMGCMCGIFGWCHCIRANLRTTFRSIKSRLSTTSKCQPETQSFEMSTLSTLCVISRSRFIIFALNLNQTK